MRFDDHAVGNPLQSAGLYGESGDLSLRHLRGWEFVSAILVSSSSEEGDTFEACPVEAMEAVRLQMALGGVQVWDVEFRGVRLGSGVTSVRIGTHGADTRRVRLSYLREAADPGSVLDEVLS